MKKKIAVLLVAIIILLSTGCTKQLVNADKQRIINETEKFNKGEDGLKKIIIFDEPSIGINCSPIFSKYIFINFCPSII